MTCRELVSYVDDASWFMFLFDLAPTKASLLCCIQEQTETPNIL